MIHEIDEVLRGVLRGGGLAGTEVEVAFDAPSREWAARRTTPTLDAYLYDIREDVNRRERGPVAVRDEHGIVVRRRQPPRWFRLSYLVTAWTKRPEDEHRLLSAALTTLLRGEALPAAALTGPLAELGLAIPITVAVPPTESRSLADIWSALGGELKPSLDVVITAPIPVSPEYPAGPPVTEWTSVKVRGTDGTLDDSAQRTRRLPPPARPGGPGGPTGAGS